MKKTQKVFQKIFPTIPKKSLEIFASCFEVKVLPKGHLILREGEVCKSLYFISKGVSMCYYEKKGKRYVDEFSLDEEFITDYSSFILQKPSNKNIILLEDSEVFQISHQNLVELHQKDDCFIERIGRISAEQLYISWHERSRSLLMDTAAERYKNLVKLKPSILQRVPQYLIAEYLGVTPESLSRVRRQLSGK